MAKITPSALITAIQGKWNDSCFQMWKGAIVVRRNPRPRKIISESRYNFRGTVASLSGCFYSMTAYQRLCWRCYAELLPTSVTGYNAFMARGTALEIANHADLCVYFNAPTTYSPPISPAPITLCYYPSTSLYCVIWTNPNCGSVYVQGFLSVQPMFSNEKSPKWKIFDTVPSTDLHMIFDASSFSSDQMIRFTARSINMRGEISVKANPNPPPILPGSTTLLYPTGGETLYTDSSCLILWRSKSTNNVKLEYSTDNGANWISITDSISAYLGQYTWTVPTVESPNYKIKITNTEYPTIYDESASVFNVINKPGLLLTSPNGSEEWTEKEKHNITWTHTNCIDVKIQYSTNNGVSYTTIINQTSADALSYEWTIPDDASSQCRVKILCYEDQSIIDVSDNTFSIIDYHVISNIAYTDESIFHNASTITHDICFLTDTKFVVAYRDETADYLKCVIGTVASDKSISYGNHYQPLAGDTWILDVYRLSDTKFIVVMAANPSGELYHKIRGIVCTVSGTVITWGSFNTSADHWMKDPAACGMSSTKLLSACWNATNLNAQTRIYSISGTTITFGSTQNFKATEILNIHCARQDDTHALIAYSDTESSNRGTLILATLSGTTLSFGSEKIFNSTGTEYISICFYDSTHFIIAYCDTGDSSKGKLKIGTVDGAAITFSVATTFNSDPSTYIDVKKIDSNTLLVAFSSSTTPSIVKIITITDGSISLSNGFTFSTNKTLNNKLAVQTILQFLISYRDFTDNDKGKIKIGYDT